MIMNIRTYLQKNNYIKYAATPKDITVKKMDMAWNKIWIFIFCVVVESRGSTASFGRQRVVGASGSDHLFVKVLHLLFVHLQHHRPLQLHGRACRVQSVR